MEIHVAVIRNPRGAGRRLGMEGLFTEDDRLKCSRGITKIVNNDNLCLARSVVVALAKLNLQKIDREKSPVEWRNAQSRLTQLQNTRRKVQTREARQLHLNAGFQLNYIPSFEDIVAFERVTNSQIIVFRHGKVDKPMYVGSEERQRTIYLLYVKHPLRNNPGHFHPIMSIEMVLGSSGFCHKCLTCYDKSKGHKEDNIWSLE